MHDNSTSTNFHAPFGEQLNRVRIEAMLLRENPRAQGLFGVIGIHRNRGLRDDRAMIHFLIDEVDCCPGDADAVLQRLALGMSAGERGQQRGVDIDDPLGKGADEERSQDTHETRQDHQLDLMGVEALNKCRLESLA